jgi:hypothetical protein
MKKISALLVVALFAFGACHHSKSAAKTTPAGGTDTAKPAGGDTGTAAPAGGDATKPEGDAKPAEPPADSK